MASAESSAIQHPSVLLPRHRPEARSEDEDRTIQDNHTTQNGYANGNADAEVNTPIQSRSHTGVGGDGQLHLPAPIPAYRPVLQDPSILPDGRHSLSGISVRALAMGLGLGVGASGTILLAWNGEALWRVPFFVAALALFHFLEFWTTAQYNTPLATPTAFLLTANGWAYNAAHVSAILEATFVQSGLLARWTGLHFWTLLWDAESSVKLAGLVNSMRKYRCLPHDLTSSGLLGSMWLALGFTLLILGQIIRSLAMAKAGRNFNHTVQTYRRQEHELVTIGVYKYLRHPSYFGFFWWALGTQVILGNTFCLAAYSVVLWRFFADRVRKEEVYLISFFGKQYIDYRSKTWVGIPGIP